MSVDKKNSRNTINTDDWFSYFNRSVVWLPLLIFIALALAVVFSGVTFQRNLETTTQQTIMRLVHENQLKTLARLQAYGLVSKSGIGLLQAGQVTNDSWNSHVEVFDVAESYPAVRAIGFARVPSLSVDKLESTEALLEYIYPQTAGSERLIGVNIATDKTWAETVARSASSGQEALTDVFNLTAGEENGEENLTFLLFTPVYNSESTPTTEAERLKQLRGVVFVAFDAEQFFSQIYNQEDERLAYLQIYQGDANRPTILYEYGDHPPVEDRNTYRQTLDVLGRQLGYEYEFSNRSLISDSQRFIAQALPIVGLMLSLLLAIIVSFSLKSRNQRLSMLREHEIQEAKDRLLSLASHQLRTPATGVKQYMGMVLQGFAGDISEQQRDFLERAYASNERQLHIINDILYLAKLDAGRIVLTKTKFDLAELVRSSVDELATSAKEAGITITQHTPKKATVTADSHMFRMVLENLLTNAIKYTESGGEVTVRLVRLGDNYTVSVTDTGVGIEEKDIDKLFKQFVRIPNERSSSVTGTGVGLYLAKSLIRLHKGDISVTSTPGKGSTFTILLPRGV